jgi:hypothetical protein
MSADPPIDPVPAATGATVAVQATAGSSTSLPADLLAEVEREQAVADLQATLKARDAEVEKLKKDKDTVAVERDGAGTSSLLAHGG